MNQHIPTSSLDEIYECTTLTSMYLAAAAPRRGRHARTHERAQPRHFGDATASCASDVEADDDDDKNDEDGSDEVDAERAAAHKCQRDACARHAAAVSSWLPLPSGHGVPIGAATAAVVRRAASAGDGNAAPECDATGAMSVRVGMIVVTTSSSRSIADDDEDDDDEEDDDAELLSMTNSARWAASMTRRRRVATPAS